jgi:Ras-related protein Rab-1A
MAKTFLKRAYGVLIVFDLTSEVSFKNCVNWMREVNKHVHENACKVMIGNKSDLVDEIKVEDEYVQLLCDKHNM